MIENAGLNSYNARFFLEGLRLSGIRAEVECRTRNIRISRTRKAVVGIDRQDRDGDMRYRSRIRRAAKSKTSQ
jgi:hypothetical protein